jgi:pre-mRNA-splicing factor ATP-dependent RNA helicase DHX16
VEILYTKQPEADYLDASVVTTLQIHVTQPVPGDILIFFTGQQEIEAARDALVERTKGLGNQIRELVICPIFSQLPAEEQAKVFLPTPFGSRKVVLATNIAETSLTIDGIRYVVVRLSGPPEPERCGLTRGTAGHGLLQADGLQPSHGHGELGGDARVARRSAAARGKGRAHGAGKVFPTVHCLVVCARAGGEPRAGNPAQQPVQCAAVHGCVCARPGLTGRLFAQIVLLLKSLGINDLIHFDFMDPPPAETLVRSLEQLCVCCSSPAPGADPVNAVTRWAL